jgi:hypothetical protein
VTAPASAGGVTQQGAKERPQVTPATTTQLHQTMCREHEWNSSRRTPASPSHPMQTSTQRTLRSILWLNSTHGRSTTEAVMRGAERMVACLNDLEPEVRRLTLEFVFDAFEDALLARPPRSAAAGSP